MLSGDEIRRLAVVGLSDGGTAAAHIQPNGVDLSLDAIWRFLQPGVLGRSSEDRRLPSRADVEFDFQGWADLPAGTYGVRYAEWVEVPGDCGGLVFPRSSLLRMGLHVPTAVWDAGYAGRGEGLLQVSNAQGVRLQRGARIVQLVLFRLTEPAASRYAGAYQHENQG